MLADISRLIDYVQPSSEGQKTFEMRRERSDPEALDDGSGSDSKDGRGEAADGRGTTRLRDEPALARGPSTRCTARKTAPSATMPKRTITIFQPTAEHKRSRVTISKPLRSFVQYLVQLVQCLYNGCW